MLRKKKPVAFAAFAIALLLQSFCACAKTEMNIETLVGGLFAGYRYCIAASGSMEPAIEVGDSLVIDTLLYTRIDPTRGDVVAFYNPVDAYPGEDVVYISRIIGLPGETVEINSGEIYIDGEADPLEEPYLKEKWVEKSTGFYFELPEDSYLLLGDNRNNSSDSRYWASIAQKRFDLSAEEAQNLSFVSGDELIGKISYKVSFEKIR